MYIGDGGGGEPVSMDDFSFGIEGLKVRETWIENTLSWTELRHAVTFIADARRRVEAERDLHRGEGRDRHRAEHGAPEVDQEVRREAAEQAAGGTGKIWAP